MEIVFQNRREDLDPFYTYLIKETEQGKRASKQIFRASLIWAVLVSMLFGSLAWGISGKWQVGIGVAILMLIILVAVRLLMTGFEPVFMPAFEVYKKQEKSLTPKDLQILQLPKTIMIDDRWLEIRSSEALHRWRWGLVDLIGLTAKFIFIIVGSCFAFYVPKRDFPSEASFVEFGKKLIELKEKNKDQSIRTR
ncbi:MAG TPA: hypothetical protein VK897_27720 [Anaerolineales bacterium]|nr:hypothetical protein [Anaerolineales bacterium]